MPFAGSGQSRYFQIMQTNAEPCLETKPQQAAKPRKVFQPIKSWTTREEMAALVSRQPLMSWEEKVAQINRSLGVS
jgi:DNA relaxase NicK